MKKLLLLSAIVFGLLINNIVLGDVITSMCNGYWNDVSTWENNSIPNKGDTIIIDHYISFDTTLYLDDNFLTISKYGELCGQYHLIVDTGSVMYVYGELAASRVEMWGPVKIFGHLHTLYLIIDNYLCP